MPRRCRPRKMANESAIRRTSSSPRVSQRHRAVPFGQPLAVGVEDQGDVGVHRLPITQQRTGIGLPRRRRQQVVAPTTWSTPWASSSTTTARLYAGTRRRGGHQVVHRTRVAAMQQIGHGVLGHLRTQPQCRWPPGGASLGPFRIGEVPAGAGISTLRRMWRTGCLQYFPSAAITFVNQSAAGEIADRRGVTPVCAVWYSGPRPRSARSRRGRRVAAPRRRRRCDRRGPRPAPGTADPSSGRTARPAPRA